MFDRTLMQWAKEILDLCRSGRLKLATAESCTGGLVSAVLTSIAGASDVLDRGFVVYSNEAKHEMLGIPRHLIDEHGAVSEAVARAMAETALERSRADITISITGVAGPGGGTAEKPVGLVHMACARRGNPTLHRRMLFEDEGRDRIRELSVLAAFELIRENVGAGSLTA